MCKYIVLSSYICVFAWNKLCNQMKLFQPKWKFVIWTCLHYIGNIGNRSQSAFYHFVINWGPCIMLWIVSTNKVSVLLMTKNMCEVDFSFHKQFKCSTKCFNYLYVLLIYYCFVYIVLYCISCHVAVSFICFVRYIELLCMKWALWIKLPCKFCAECYSLCSHNLGAICRHSWQHMLY